MRKVFADSIVHSVYESPPGTYKSDHTSASNIVRGCYVKIMEASTQALLSDEFICAATSMKSNQMLSQSLCSYSLECDLDDHLVRDNNFDILVDNTGLHF